ncbi:hypothetical protein ACTSEZ_17560 [Metabacillus sp. JX24]|uniref:hypothetical protein n=1 Tax=Metabacillus sp. JX24 TaxID=3240759 RepID=UPI00350F8BEB
MNKIAIILLSLLILVGCNSESDSTNHNTQKTQNEIKVNTINNLELMGRTGMTVGYFDARPSDKEDHFTLMTRSKEDIVIWLLGLKNQVNEFEYLSEIQFGIANGDEGFDSSIESSKKNIAGTLKEETIKKFNNSGEDTEFSESSHKSIKELPFYSEYNSLDYNKSETVMDVMTKLVYFNLYPEVEVKDNEIFDQNNKLIMRYDSTGDNHKWQIAYNAEFLKFGDVEFKLHKDGLKRKAQMQLLSFDIYQALNGEKTQTKYGVYAQKAVDWYLKAKNQTQITPDEVMNMYYTALENPKTDKISNNFKTKITPLLKLSEESLGEEGPPNELLPHVRLRAVEENILWTKVEVLEFANESYKTGRSLRLTAKYNNKTADWYLEDIEIIEASDKPFVLSSTEVERFFSHKGIEIQLSDEQVDPNFFQFTVSNENQMYVKGSELKIDRGNGLISYVDGIIDSAEDNDFDEIIEEDIDPAVTHNNPTVNEETDNSNKSPSEDIENTDNHEDSGQKKNGDLTIKNYEGDWIDAKGIHFIKVKNITNNSADITFDICSNNCVRIASVGPVNLTFNEGIASYKYDDDGWGNNGEFTIRLNPGEMSVTHNGTEIILFQ